MIRIKDRAQPALLMLAAIFTLWSSLFAATVNAASGTVYTCVIHPCYAHPVTGEVEDSGGAASYVTGQGMVEGAVYTTGILEVMDGGQYFLTIRMSLMDYTSNHSFSVQNVGDSGWSQTAVGVTGNGSDSNGTTADICIQVPSENCVVRGSMYVTPMQRDVIFYLYPSDYSTGNNTNMNATMVTTASTSGSATTSGGGTATPSTNAQSSGNASGGTSSTTTPNALQSSITEAAQPTDSAETAGDSTLDTASGLSLSTVGEQASDFASSLTGLVAASTVAKYISITICGLILMGMAALIVYLFRKNWYKWGGGGYDDDEWQIR